MRILQDYCINMVLWWSNVVEVIKVTKLKVKNEKLKANSIELKANS